MQNKGRCRLCSYQAPEATAHPITIPEGRDGPEWALVVIGREAERGRIGRKLGDPRWPGWPWQSDPWTLTWWRPHRRPTTPKSDPTATMIPHTTSEKKITTLALVSSDFRTCQPRNRCGNTLNNLPLSNQEARATVANLMNEIVSTILTKHRQTRFSSPRNREWREEMWRHQSSVCVLKRLKKQSTDSAVGKTPDYHLRGPEFESHRGQGRTFSFLLSLPPPFEDDR